MPLLRYEIGDTGEMVEGACGCGRGLPLVRPTLGRSVDYITLEDGTVVPPYNLTMAIRNDPGHAPVPVRPAHDQPAGGACVAAPGVRRRGRREIQECLRPVLHGLTAEVRIVENIAPEPSGKYRVVRSEATASRGVLSEPER